MNHPAVKNNTSILFEPFFITDEDGLPVFVPIAKATYEIRENMHIVISREQVPVSFSGETFGNSDTSSYRYEPECSFVKPFTDVILISHAYAPKKGAKQITIVLQVGPIRKAVRVVGDRYWIKSLGVISMTGPKSFDKIPLTYENAFGGWDRSHIDPQQHTFDPRNPVGTGFRDKNGRFEEGIKLPNIEDPRYLIKAYGDTPPPAGFGFISPNWQPRAAFAGTYDEKWQKERMPLLPKDFDRRFFNAAPQDQIVPGYLKGDEPVVVTNASPSGRIAFNLPGVQPPVCKVELRGNQRHELRTNLDTVIINTDDNLVFLIWRTYLTLKSGPQDVVAIEVVSESMPQKIKNT